MEPLLSAIVTWLALNFGMPAIHEHPQVRFVAPQTMEAVRGSAQTVEAIYEDASRTIFLDEKWEGKTPAELSVLVHEMVHHLQNLAGLKYECPQAREQQAYAAQQRWLGLFGSDLGKAFELDAMTLLVRTRCMG
jgi:hypothetical protein